MDITACLCVTVMLHTVIMSTAVYSPEEVRSLIILLYLVSPMTDLKDSDRCCDTQFYYQVKGQKDFREKSMVHCYILQILFQNV